MRRWSGQPRGWPVYADRVLGSSDPSKVWITWWLGDATGAILVTPLILLWAHPGERLSEARALEFAIMLGSVVAVGLVMFAYPPIAGENLPLQFLAIPVLIWAAFRFAQREAVTACGLLSGLAVWGTVRGYGPFGALPPEHALPMLQGFTGSLSVTVLAASAEVAIRRERDWEVRRLNEELERRVLARTEEARRAHARLAEAQEVGHVGSWEWNIASNSVWWSPELFRIYAVSPAHVVPSYEGFLERVHPDDRAAVDRAVRTALERRDAFSFEHRLVRPDGSVRTMYARGLVACDAAGNPVRMTGIGQDITERKQAEEARALLIQEQAARARRRRRAVERRVPRALTHELRTPLNAILGWSHDPGRGSDGREDLARARVEDDRAQRPRAERQIIEDLLDMSRIISGKVRLDVSRSDLVASRGRSAIDDVRPAADARGVRLTRCSTRAPGPSRATRDRLQQVMWNLLTNAIKFTPRRRCRYVLQVVRSQVELQRSRRHGPGIGPEFLPHVFERFRQADPSTTRRARRARAGTGDRAAARRTARRDRGGGKSDGPKRRHLHGQAPGHRVGSCELMKPLSVSSPSPFCFSWRRRLPPMRSRPLRRRPQPSPASAPRSNVSSKRSVPPSFRSSRRLTRRRQMKKSRRASSRPSGRPAPVFSSIRTATSSPTRTWSKAPPRFRWRCHRQAARIGRSNRF